MGYFPNGTAGDAYETEYCARCIHRNGKDGQSHCAVMWAHDLYNYKDCNNDESILHILIPRDKNHDPLECAMFHEGEPVQDTRLSEKDIAPQYRDWAKKKGLL